MAITSFLAGEAISAGNVVYLNSSGFLYRARAVSLEQASPVGVAIDGGSEGSLLRVNSDSLYSNASSLTPGEYQYLSILNPGQFVNYTTWASELSNNALANVYLTIIGRAVSTTALDVELSKPISVLNPTAVFLLESGDGVALDAILQEDGSILNLETA